MKVAPFICTLYIQMHIYVKMVLYIYLWKHKDPVVASGEQSQELGDGGPW